MKLRSKSARHAIAAVCAFALLAAACGSSESLSEEASLGLSPAATAAPTQSSAAASSTPDVSESETPAPTSAVQTDSAEPAAVAVDYPQFAATTVDGVAFELGSYAGQDVLLWFWAPW